MWWRTGEQESKFFLKPVIFNIILQPLLSVENTYNKKIKMEIIIKTKKANTAVSRGNKVKIVPVFIALVYSKALNIPMKNKA